VPSAAVIVGIFSAAAAPLAGAAGAAPPRAGAAGFWADASAGAVGFSVGFVVVVDEETHALAVARATANANTRFHPPRSVLPLPVSVLRPPPPTCQREAPDFTLIIQEFYIRIAVKGLRLGLDSQGGAVG
jgi:hypothetical protein